jgi:hypothetical protein
MSILAPMSDNSDRCTWRDGLFIDQDNGKVLEALSRALHLTEYAVSDTNAMALGSVLSPVISNTSDPQQLASEPGPPTETDEIGKQFCSCKDICILTDTSACGVWIRYEFFMSTTN